MNPYRVYQEHKPRDIPGRVWLPLYTTTLARGSHIHGWVSTRIAKAPKRRFSPGEYLRFRGQLYQVKYAYRTEEAPSEWVYYLEERKTLDDAPTELQKSLEEDFWVGSGVSRVIQGVFPDDIGASSYFSDLYRASDALVARNGTLVSGGAVVVSSGEVVP